MTICGKYFIQTDNEALKEIFGKYGNVVEARVAGMLLVVSIFFCSSSSFELLISLFFPVDRDTNRSRGFGFVTMENATDAEEAVRGVTGMELNGREIRVEVSTGVRKSGGGGGRGGDRGDRGGYDRRGDRGYDRGGDRGGDRRDHHRGDRDRSRDRYNNRDDRRERGGYDRAGSDRRDRGGDRGGDRGKY